MGVCHYSGYNGAVHQRAIEEVEFSLEGFIVGCCLVHCIIWNKASQLIPGVEVKGYSKGGCCIFAF